MNAATDWMRRDRLAQDKTTDFINCFIASVLPASGRSLIHVIDVMFVCPPGVTCRQRYTGQIRVVPVRS